jgi:hypothetical protein
MVRAAKPVAKQAVVDVEKMLRRTATSCRLSVSSGSCQPCAALIPMTRSEQQDSSILFGHGFCDIRCERHCLHGNCGIDFACLEPTTVLAQKSERFALRRRGRGAARERRDRDSARVADRDRDWIATAIPRESPGNLQTVAQFPMNADFHEPRRSRRRPVASKASSIRTRLCLCCDRAIRPHDATLAECKMDA